MLVMVLNDGDSFTSLTGCKIVHIDDEQLDGNLVNYDEGAVVLDDAVTAVYSGRLESAGRVLVEFSDDEGAPVALIPDDGGMVVISTHNQE